ncbi:MAG: hypothetical protein HDT29_00435 [Clostridiales bacterium]|nr:hypothetical protein [Clostridiales bacterium]
MSQTIEERLLQAIKKDDIKAFDAMMERAQCGAYRLGRFPTLSLLYLYNSRKILKKYEEGFLKITAFETLREPAELSKKFSSKAGKCLRLYLNEIVSPIEMLLILDKTKRLQEVFPVTKPSSSVKGRLRSIYYIKYSLSMKFEGDNIILDKRPLTYGEKKKMATVAALVLVAITIAIVAPITTVAVAPPSIDKYIDLTSKEEFTLNRNVVVTKDISVEEVNCTIIGNGHKIIFRKGASLGTLNGKLSDLIIETSGDTIFTSISEKATIENTVVNVKADLTTTDGTAFVALNNYGTIDGVSVNVRGKINAISTATVDTYGGIVQTNNYKVNSATQTVYRGVINKCVVNYTDFSLVGTTSANASFGGVAGINNGYLQDCKVTGEIVADTFDIAGVCSVNNGSLNGDVNEASLSQTSADTEWNPIVCGIVITNVNTVKNCVNLGAISATGNGFAYVGGISAHSNSLISNCRSSGDITVTAQNVCAGGILASSEITYSYNQFTGTLNLSFGEVESCISESKISVSVIGDEPAYVGGIVGIVQEQGFEQYVYGEDGYASKDEDGNYMIETIYFGGGVTNSYFIGQCLNEVAYFGNIVGVCGANIYESNSASFGDTEYHNFEGNYYAANGSKAFGATRTADGSFASVEDKGATLSTVEEIRNSQAYKSVY